MDSIIISQDEKFLEWLIEPKGYDKEITRNHIVLVKDTWRMKTIGWFIKKVMGVK